MRNLLIVLSLFCLVACYTWNVKGYSRNPFYQEDILWEAPVDINSEEEQVFEVPYVKYGTRFSICFDSLFVWEKPDSYRPYLDHDFVTMSFSIGDSTFSRENKSLICCRTEFACPIEGSVGVYFDVPEGYDLETGGTLKVKFSQIVHLKNVPNPRVVLAYSSHFK